MFGYAGRILHVDLASGRHWTEDLDEGLTRKHLGSRGLGAHVLFRDLAAGTDPFERSSAPATGSTSLQTTAPSGICSVTAC